ncbi:MAG: 16S rRNA (cytosine(1402)-N(4))-methyltransferase RsmH [Deltaproteobacteria bacterium]|nr:16S rRNA (cytosine(1402)-N(4))-methyltransferase RsmH [Deltaproteobacteria bacterium]MBW2047150.1 16S rRNA (cytosine(1402)-N(4))-methyltransferase RsmH [Deltaproteobacteria bacterium]MBW2109827.1 16S rRNA (cytosine(1402)-N(4))-methyltransferase RsmH [Deltaproteobacteria bacterium]MBW2352537.1 16S rRNA (cytosine(1402)-N(4))-methyltransferase RsmH [Deltaproteobacteria bacterium]
MKYLHVPVLLEETVGHLVHDPEGTYVDGTAGTGGHSAAILEKLTGRGRLISLDRDPEAVSLSRRRLTGHGNRAVVIRANFADMDRVLEGLNIPAVEGVLLDLGMSSHQLEKSGRGFSFKRGETLDMRMNPDNHLVASHLVNNAPPGDLEKILQDYGEERNARTIVRAIVRERAKGPIETSSRLAEVISAVSPGSRRHRGIHPATRTFQALRIAVNRELKHLDSFLHKTPDLMTPGGRLVVISYHSLEDRRVKHRMAQWENPCSCPPDFPRCVCGKRPVFRRLFRRGLKPAREEIDRNPRARSAIMRAAERVAP